MHYKNRYGHIVILNQHFFEDTNWLISNKHNLPAYFLHEALHFYNNQRLFHNSPKPQNILKDNIDLTQAACFPKSDLGKSLRSLVTKHEEWDQFCSKVFSSIDGKVEENLGAYESLLFKLFQNIKNEIQTKR